MKLLFDQNLSFKLCDRLADLFPGSSQVRLAGLDRADDRVIWDFAKAGGFIMVTQDADFADMAALWQSIERVYRGIIPQSCRVDPRFCGG